MTSKKQVIDFRSMARAALARARVQLASRNSDHLRYAALELRMAMEALTYGKAQAYEAELQPEDYETWQPQKLLQQILEIDPHADVASTWTFGVEILRGVKPDNMNVIGTDQPLSLTVLKDHYSALGSLLHTPTLRQIRKGKLPDMANLAARCSTIVAFIEAVIASPIFDENLALSVSIDCGNCGEAIRRRFPAHLDQIEAQCRECSVTYTLTASDPAAQGAPRTVVWAPQKESIPVPARGVGSKPWFGARF